MTLNVTFALNLKKKPERLLKFSKQGSCRSYVVHKRHDFIQFKKGLLLPLRYLTHLVYHSQQYEVSLSGMLNAILTLDQQWHFYNIVGRMLLNVVEVVELCRRCCRGARNDSARWAEFPCCSVVENDMIRSELDAISSNPSLDVLLWWQRWINNVHGTNCNKWWIL